MKKGRLTKAEKAIEHAVEEYVPVSSREFSEIAQAIAARRKYTVLNVRLNHNDLDYIKQKARKLGVKYQTFVTEILHRVAQA